MGSSELNGKILVVEKLLPETFCHLTMEHVASFDFSSSGDFESLI